MIFEDGLISGLSASEVSPSSEDFVPDIYSCYISFQRLTLFTQQIPYDLTKAQVMAFLGPHAKVITPDLGPAIHIIMDRPTGKTMDCYIEFFSTPDARAASNSLNLRPRHMVRIADRVVDVATSSQAELLKDLFPKAKNVGWEGGVPKIQETKELYNTGFKTFVSAEEMGLLVRHAEQPHRVSDMTGFYHSSLDRLTWYCSRISLSDLRNVPTKL